MWDSYGYKLFTENEQEKEERCQNWEKNKKHNKNPHDTPRKWAGKPLITFLWLQKKIKKTLVQVKEDS